jgi:hypothetical protein
VLKTVRVTIITSLIVCLVALAVGFVAVVITGFYPGVIVLFTLTLIPVASGYFAKKINSRSGAFREKYYKTITIINLLTVLVVLWMTFVILVDRVFGVILK